MCPTQGLEQTTGPSGNRDAFAESTEVDGHTATRKIDGSRDDADMGSRRASDVTVVLGDMEDTEVNDDCQANSDDTPKSDPKEFFTQLGTLVAVFGVTMDMAQKLFGALSAGNVNAILTNALVLGLINVPTLCALLYVVFKHKIKLAIKAAIFVSKMFVKKKKQQATTGAKNLAKSGDPRKVMTLLQRKGSGTSVGEKMESTVIEHGQKSGVTVESTGAKSHLEEIVSVSDVVKSLETKVSKDDVASTNGSDRTITPLIDERHSQRHASLNRQEKLFKPVHINHNYDENGDLRTGSLRSHYKHSDSVSHTSQESYQSFRETPRSSVNEAEFRDPNINSKQRGSTNRWRHSYDNHIRDSVTESSGASVISRHGSDMCLNREYSPNRTDIQSVYKHVSTPSYNNNRSGGSGAGVQKEKHNIASRRSQDSANTRHSSHSRSRRHESHSVFPHIHNHEDNNRSNSISSVSGSSYNSDVYKDSNLSRRPDYHDYEVRGRGNGDHTSLTMNYEERMNVESRDRTRIDRWKSRENRQDLRSQRNADVHELTYEGKTSNKNNISNYRQNDGGRTGRDNTGFLDDEDHPVLLERDRAERMANDITNRHNNPSTTEQYHRQEKGRRKDTYASGGGHGSRKQHSFERDDISSDESSPSKTNAPKTSEKVMNSGVKRPSKHPPTTNVDFNKHERKSSSDRHNRNRNENIDLANPQKGRSQSNNRSNERYDHKRQQATTIKTSRKTTSNSFQNSDELESDEEKILQIIRQMKQERVKKEQRHDPNSPSSRERHTYSTSGDLPTRDENHHHIVQGTTMADIEGRGRKQQRSKR